MQTVTSPAWESLKGHLIPQQLNVPKGSSPRHSDTGASGLRDSHATWSRGSYGGNIQADGTGDEIRIHISFSSVNYNYFELFSTTYTKEQMNKSKQREHANKEGLHGREVRFTTPVPRPSCTCMHAAQLDSTAYLVRSYITLTHKNK